ncbi:hypothetical protein BKA56DRAFT_659099 [Ilyonectria sp. MPI-CAGE-AT-0026]|nr:hypothetical protein BKA56DRAFT_659099 [Ilyonectria sp. MPI-CAGE-AT-0026]
MMGNTLLAGALVLMGSVAATSPHQFYERAACNRDNLFRCFIDTRYSVQASEFCTGLSPFTATVATTTATTTTTVQALVTLDAVISTATSTTTVFTETIPTATTTLTLSVGTVAKRDATASPPKCMTNGVTYPASRITSACSCIDVPATTISATYTVSTETVTQTITSYTTPSATVTSWTTVSTATTGGVLTVTVGPPSGVNRIINGDFETKNADGWELIPASWTGQVITSSLDSEYKVTGSGNSIGWFRQTQPIYLESGLYRFGLRASILPYPYASAAWGAYAVLELVNPATGTNVTVALPGESVKQIDSATKSFFHKVEQNFEVLENAAGYNQVSIRYRGFTPPPATIDDIFLHKV